MKRMPDSFRIKLVVPVAYICLALPIVVFHTFVVPPSLSPDETLHFGRAEQISRGVIIGEKLSATRAGGTVDASFVAIERFHALRGRPEVKVSPDMFVGARERHWGESIGPTGLPMVVYPPMFYLPSVVAILVAKQIKLPAFDTLYLCRLLTAFCSVLTAAGAIAVARRGQALLFLCLSLPMALALFASCSEDGLMIASAALAIALLSRSTVDTPLSRPPTLAVGILMGCVVAARPPYAPLLGLLLFPLTRRQPRSQEVFSTLLALALALCISIFWIAFGIVPIIVPPEAPGVNAAEQLQRLIDHPELLLPLVSETVRVTGPWLFEQFVGTLGFLDTRMPQAYYGMVAWAFLLVIILLPVGEKVSITAVRFGLAALWVTASLALLFGYAYVTWNQVGGSPIVGAQGRYLFPIFMSFALVGASGGGVWHHMSVRLAMAAALCIAVANMFVVPSTLMFRFYG